MKVTYAFKSKIYFKNNHKIQHYLQESHISATSQHVSA